MENFTQHKEFESTPGFVNLSDKNIKDSDKIFESLLKFKEMSHLDLSNNKITSLPDDLSNFTNLKFLSLTNNPIINFELAAKSLATLPNLTELKINLSNQDDAIAILSNLPNLAVLNDKSTKEEGNLVDIEEKDIESITLNNEIQNFNNILHRITQKLKLYPGNESKIFYENFQNLLKEQITMINEAVDPTVPNYIYATNVIKSKNAIFKFFQDKLIWMIEKTDPELVGILKDVSIFLDDSQNSCYDLFYKLKSKIEEKFDSYKKQSEDSAKNSEEIIASLREQLERNNREKETILKSTEEERKILLEKITRLESENSLMTQKLIKNAKNACDDSCNYPRKHTNGVSSAGNKSVIASSNDVNNKNEEYFNKLTGKNAMVGPIGSRVLTKKMLIEIIEDIYQSKTAFDKKCLDCKMPRETLEQHMYTYLNQKYGLKNLIIEWAASIVNGIRMYSAEDPEVCLFGKILRNELEEDARIVIIKLKSTIADLLSYFLKAKNPLKSNGEIRDMAISKQNNFILHDEWRGIINYLFENDEVKQLESKITNFIKKKYYDINKIEANVGNKKLTREELQNLSKVKEEYKITYSDFVKCVLDFQIRLRDKYLKNFTNLFRTVDRDNNGIVNEEEFVNLIALMNIYHKESLIDNCNRLLNAVDPFNNKQITFTECVNLFADEMCSSLQSDETGNKYVKINVLDKISMDENCLNTNA